jgi:hypothetical protein
MELGINNAIRTWKKALKVCKGEQLKREEIIKLDEIEQVPTWMWHVLVD